MFDPVTLAVLIFVLACFTGAICVWHQEVNRPKLKREPDDAAPTKTERYMRDFLAKIRPGATAERHRPMLPPAMPSADRLTTRAGDVILLGDHFALLGGDGTVLPGTTQKVIAFDPPMAILQLLGSPPTGVRPIRLHPQELLSRWARVDTLLDDDDRPSECAFTQVLPGPPSPTTPACPGCGGKAFRSTCPGHVSCVSCGTSFAS